MKKHFLLKIFFAFLISQHGFSQSSYYRIYSDTLLWPSILKAIPTHDNGFLSLGGGNTVVINKFDSTGSPMWSKEYAAFGSDLRSGDVIELPNHDFIITGRYFFGNQPTYLLMRIDSSGNLVNANIDQDTSHVLIYPGDIRIAGITSDHGIVFSGIISVDSLQQKSFPFISKIDSAGNCLWLKYFEVDTSAFCTNIQSVQQVNGDIIVTGFYIYSPNSRWYFFIAKFDSSGSLVWLKHGFQTTKFEGIANHEVEWNGSYYILTTQDTPTQIQNVPHIYKISASTGDLIWHAQYNFWNSTNEHNTLIKYSNDKLVFTCRDDSDGACMNVEIDSAGAIIKSIRYEQEPFPNLVIIKNTVELYSATRLLTGLAFDSTFLGILFATIDTTYNTICMSSDISLPSPVYYSDSMITKSHTVYSANASFTDVTSNIQTNTFSISYIDFCDYVNVTELSSPMDLVIFPNPATNQFVVESSDPDSYREGENTTLEIFNLLGEKIYTSSYHGPLTVDCGHFPRGLYFVRLTNAEKQLTQKLVIGGE